jgi:hypothetical protein
VVTDLGGMAEQVRPEIDGLVFEPGTPTRWRRSFDVSRRAGNSSAWERASGRR